MKQFIVVVFATCLLLTLVGTGFAVSGSLFSPLEHEQSTGLMLCDGLPCFQKITPGRTSWAEVMAIFGGRSIINQDSSYGQIALFPSSNSTFIASILLDRPIHPITVGTLVALYGRPTCIIVFRNSNTLLLHYPLLHVLAEFSNSAFTPFSHARSIVLGSPVETSNAPVPCTSPPPGAALKEESAWQIFAKITRYLHTS